MVPYWSHFLQEACHELRKRHTLSREQQSLHLRKGHWSQTRLFHLQSVELKHWTQQLSPSPLSNQLHQRLTLPQRQQCSLRCESNNCAQRLGLKPVLAAAASTTITATPSVTTQAAASSMMPNPWHDFRSITGRAACITPMLGKSGQPLSLTPATGSTEPTGAGRPFTLDLGSRPKGGGKGTGKGSYSQRRFATRDFYMSQRQPDTIFTTDQHTQYFNDAIRRLKGSGKAEFSQNDFHFYGTRYKMTLLANT